MESSCSFWENRRSEKKKNKMAENARTQRLRYAKKRTLSSLLDVFKVVMPVPEPAHYYCPKAKMFVRVELDELKESKRRELVEFKNDCSDDTIVQVQVYKEGATKPEFEEIR